MLLALILSSGTASAGYGDVVDSYPSWAERATLLWTNAARVDPQAFNSTYKEAGCDFVSFEPGEQSAKPPLYYSDTLNDAARFHSIEMNESGVFSHDSPDGTPFDQRVSRFYTETQMVGENIAYGYGSPYHTVIGGWMCSAGHRANIMTGSYIELGTGVDGTYYTQNFGGGAADWDGPIAMGVHEDEFPGAGDVAEFYADWQHADAPKSFELVLDGVPVELEHKWGEEEMGIYWVEIELSEDDEGDCHPYYFQATDSDGNDWVFPEEGSYLFGQRCSEDWESGHKVLDDDDDGRWRPGTWTIGDGGNGVVGCTTGGNSQGAWLLGVLGLAGLLLRRRE
jgi:MYXO-CTERM domain-containing protein